MEVGNFRRHTIKELKQLTHDVQKVREQQLLYHQEQREKQREARAAKAAAAIAPPPPPPPPPPPVVTPAAPSWAQVVRKGRKRTPTTTPAKPATPAAPATTPKPPSTKKGPTLRDRRLMIKRDGSPLTTSIIAIRDSINTALQATLIQRVECNSANDLLIFFFFFFI